MAEPEVLITSEPSKLPGEVAALLDPAVPLPDGVRFFEKRYEFGEMLRNLMIAIGLALAALIVIPFGIASLFSRQPTTVYSSVDYLPLGFGLVLALASWMMFVSLGTSLRLRNVQKLGQCTRRGTFLTPTSLIQASENDTTVIPPSQFRGIEGSTVKYFTTN